MRTARIIAVPLGAILCALVNLPHDANAQMFQCPPPSTQLTTGPYSFECRCPDGSLAGISGCPQSVQEPAPSICPAGFSYCAVSGACCGSGLYCSNYGCTPIGAVDCGTGYCNPGQVCTSNGHCMPAANSECGDHSCNPGYHCGSRNNCMQNGTTDCGNGASCPAGNKCARNGAHCISQDTVDCGNHFCAAGFKCASGGQCIASNAADCGNGTHCDNGKCSQNAKMCLTNDQIDCGRHACGSGFQCGANDKCIPKDTVDCGGGHYCDSGMKCGSDYQCMTRNAIDCGSGRSCPDGNVCVNAGAECLTPTELAQRRVLQRQLDQEATAQSKEDRAAEQWLKNEQTQLAKRAQVNEQIGNSIKSAGHTVQPVNTTQFDQKWCPRAALMQYGAFSTGEIANQRCVCAQQELPLMARSSGNCARVQVMIGAGCYSNQQIAAEAAYLGCSGLTAALQQAPSTVPNDNLQPSPSGNTRSTGLALNPSLSDIAHLTPGSLPPTPPSGTTVSPAVLPVGPFFTSSSPPAQQPDLWDNITSANEKLLDSGPGNVLTDTLQAAGQPFAEKLIPSPISSLGDVQDLATAAAAIRRGDIFAAAQSAADYTAITSSGYLGAALMPENPTLGQSIGQASAQFAITSWKMYAAPAVGDELVKLFPGTFIPGQSTGPSPSR
jgi:hypothetical protein